MDYVRLGASGLKVSRICLGMMSFGGHPDEPWILEAAEAEPIVRRAVESGVTYFDTADMYSAGASEELTGRLLSKFFARRDDYVLATKVFFPMGDGPNDRGLSRKHVMSAIDASLTRLGTDYVDLYQIHRWDPETPIEETLEALHDVVKAGKARYIGASAMYAWQFSKAQHLASAHGWTRFVAMQNRYNLVYREEERETIPLCVDQGVGVIPYSPLARGLLAGNRSRGGESLTTRARHEPAQTAVYDESDFDIVEAAQAIAAERGIPTAAVALAWISQRPGVVAPIVGATRVGHIDDAIASLDVSLTADEIERLESPYKPHPILNLE